MNKKVLVEVGANDGIIASKSRKLLMGEEWIGILIEPVKFYFNKLVETYQGKSNVTLLNHAISLEERKDAIYRIDPKFLPDGHYGHGVNSFNRNHAGIKRLEKQFGTQSVLSEDIMSYPLSKIILEQGTQCIDLLIIDTEGNDFNVIKSIDFSVIKPIKIIYENKHLHNDNETCENYLKSLGYAVCRSGSDTICTL